jgi:hypothetical protein
MRVAGREAAVCSDFVHLVVAEDFEDRWEEVQAYVPRELLDPELLFAKVVRKRRFQGELGHSLSTFPQELADRFHDGVAVVDFARDQLVFVGKVFFQILDELA